MYKVDYYTLAVVKDSSTGKESIGNIKQYNDILYTDFNIEDIPNALEASIANRKGIGKYVAVITNIEQIKGHLL